MRRLLLPLFALACIGAAEDEEAEILRPAPPSMKGEALDKLKDRLRGDVVKGADGKETTLSEFLRANCQDRLEYADEDQTRVTVTQGPLLRRGPNTPEKPLAIYAVDRRENGCGVMVMMGNPDDVRPMPKLDADDHRLMPADGDRER